MVTKLMTIVFRPVSLSGSRMSDDRERPCEPMISMSWIGSDEGRLAMNKTMLALAASTCLLLAASDAGAQQGTTLAGPTQGRAANGAASTQPSGAAGVNGMPTPGGGTMSVGGGRLSGTGVGAMQNTTGGAMHSGAPTH